jgi:hypothetical protein
MMKPNKSPKPDYGAAFNGSKDKDTTGRSRSGVKAPSGAYKGK